MYLFLIYIIHIFYRPPDRTIPGVEEMILTTRSQITKGLLRVYLSALGDQIIPPVQLHFNSPEIQFLSRYRVFLNVSSPTPLQYSHYLTMVETITQSQQSTTNDLIQMSIKCFKSIKEFMSKINLVHESNQGDPSISHTSLFEKDKLILQEYSGLVKVNTYSYYFY